jgi:hypothetical protein
VVSLSFFIVSSNVFLKGHLTFMRTDIGIESALRGSQNL